MELIKQIVIENPPTKYVDVQKKIDVKTGKLKEKTYYLTANLFYSQRNTFLTNKIVQECKKFLYNYFENIPELSVMRIELVCQSERDNYDLDNKGYFWLKCILDLMKKPTKSRGKKVSILSANSLNIIEDDSCKFVKNISIFFQKGEPKLIVNIYGFKKK